MKENQIPTARDFAIDIDIYFDSEEEHVELANKLIEFAKLHVTEALNEVYLQNEEILSKEIVMNSYSLNKIK
jgi:hypothetical protein